MPASLIAVTEGSGKNLESFQWVIGANTVERQVVAMGEQHLADYTCATAAISTATAASHLLQLANGASLKMRLRWILIYQAVAATTATLMQIDVFRLTTAAGTGGTAITPNPLDPGDAASGTAGMSLPTVKGTEGALVWRGVAYMMQTIAASNQLSEPILAIDVDRIRTKPFIAAAGATNGFLVKNVTAVAGGTVIVTALFSESNF